MADDLSSLLARLRFDDHALLRARDQFGFDLQHGLTQKQSRRNLCILICCGLTHEQPAPGFRAIKKLVTPEHAVEDSPAWVVLAQALAAWPRSKETHG